MSAVVLQFRRRPPSEFGACPICGVERGTMFNIGREHWFTCELDRVRWLIGENLFSAWCDESGQDQAANFTRFGTFRVVSA